MEIRDRIKELRRVKADQLQPSRFEAKARVLGRTTGFYWEGILHDMEQFSRNAILAGADFSDDKIEEIIKAALHGRAAGLGGSSDHVLRLLTSPPLTT